MNWNSDTIIRDLTRPYWISTLVGHRGDPGSNPGHSICAKWWKNSEECVLFTSTSDFCSKSSLYQWPILTYHSSLDVGLCSLGFMWSVPRSTFDPLKDWVWAWVLCYDDGQSASLSWNKAPIWGLRPDFYYCQTVAGLLMWGALSDERTGLSFTIAAGARQRSHSRVRVPWDSWPYFTVLD
jgi:hypothetical protein